MNIIRKKLDLNDKYLKLDNEEKMLFKDDVGKCSVYKSVMGTLEPEFFYPVKRSKMILRFLASHCEQLGIDILDSKYNNSFIFLTFNGDREIIEATKNTEKYKHKFVWKSVESVLPTDPIYKYAKAHVYQRNMLTLILRVNMFGSNDILFLNSYRFSPFEIYTSLLIPWRLPVRISGTDEIKTVNTNLSMYQSKLFFDDKNKCAFYPSKNSDIHEPYMMNNNIRNSIIYEIIGLMSDNRIFEKDKDEILSKDKIICLKFADGDRQFVNTLIDMGNKKFWYYEYPNKFSSDKTKYDLIKTSIDTAAKNGNSESVFLIEFYSPGSSDCYVYTSFAHKIPAPASIKRKNINSL